MIAAFVLSMCGLWQTHSVVDTAREVAQPVLPPGSELRAHDASELTGHAEFQRLWKKLDVPDTGALGVLMADSDVLATLEERRAAAEDVAVGLVRALSERLEPPLADGQRLLHLGEGRLALLGTPEQHARLDAALAAATSFRDKVRVETRIYSGNELELPAVDPRRGGLILTEHAAAELRAELEARPHELLLVPEVLVNPWRTARLTSLERTPYVSDYNVVTVPGLAHEVLDPLLAELEIGIELSVLCVPGAEGKLGLHVELMQRRLVAMPPFEITLGKEQERVTIQLPETKVIGLGGHFDLGEAETLLLTNSQTSERVAVLIEVHRVRGEPR